MLGGAVSQTKSKFSGSEQREKELGKVGKPRDSSLYQKLVVGKSVERRKGNTDTEVESRGLAGQQPSVEMRVDTVSMGEGDWTRPSQGQKGITPSLAEPVHPFLTSKVCHLCLWYLEGEGHFLRP